MLSYRNRNGNYILITENTTDHTIKIGTDGTKECLRGSANQSDQKRYASKNENELQLNVMKKLAEQLKAGDIIMFRTVQDLSHDKDYAAVIYNCFIENDIRVEFLYDPSCDFSNYRKAYIKNPSIVNDIIPNVLSSALTIPESKKILSVPKGEKKRRKSFP
jgi:hypothetical protein